MYDSRRLRGWNRFAGGSLVTMRRFWFASKRNGRMVVMFQRLSTNICCVWFSPVARVEPFGRWLSSHVCVDFGPPPSETGGWWLCLSVFQQMYAVYDSHRLRGWNRFAGGSLVTFASILVRLQAKREGGDFGLAPFNKFMLCMILAGCAGGTV